MSELTVLDQFLDPLTSCLDRQSAQRIADFEITAELQQKAERCAEKANEGTLTQEEQHEYRCLVDTADLIAILKLKASHRLVQNICS